MSTNRKKLYCLHCHQDLKQDERDFCCVGCKVAYDLLHSEGLEQFYNLSDDIQSPANYGEQENLKIWLDKATQSPAKSSGLIQLDFQLQGIRCASCVYAIEQLFVRQDKSAHIDLNPATGESQISFHKDFEIHKYLGNLQKLGYRVGPKDEKVDKNKTSDALLLKVGVLIAIALNTMTFAISTYFGLSAEEYPQISHVFSWLTVGLSTLSVLIASSIFVKPAFESAKIGLVSLDLPIAFGMLAAYFSSLNAFFTSGIERSYFDTLTIFTALMALGRYVQEKILASNREYLLADVSVEALEIRRLTPDSKLEIVQSKDLRIGDTIVLLAGEVLPVDAICAEKEAEMSHAWRTGEPEALKSLAGELVKAGAVNATARSLSFKVAAKATDSDFASLLSKEKKIRINQSSRFWAFAYVFGVLFLAILGFLIWLPESLLKAEQVATAILVVTCPCAFGIAAPLTVQGAILALRKKGVFIRDEALLSRLLKVKKIFWDKTGTLTSLLLQWKNLEDIKVVPVTEQHILLQMVSRSNHPKSRAITFALKDYFLKTGEDFYFDPHFQCEEKVGIGLVAVVKDTSLQNSEKVYTLKQEENSEELIFSMNNKQLLEFHFEEQLEQGALEEIKKLKQRGFEVFLLSGDKDSRVMKLAQEMQIDREHVFAGCKPLEKAEIIKKYDCEDTLMIGDGLNDVLAFDAAYCSGTPSVERNQIPHRADFFFVGRGLLSISMMIERAHLVKTTRKLIFVLAGVYNGIVLVLSLMGLITPLLCAILMPISSITFVLIAVLKMRSVK